MPHRHITKKSHDSMVDLRTFWEAHNLTQEAAAALVWQLTPERQPLLGRQLARNDDLCLAR